MPNITQSRIDNAMKYDSAFLKLKLPIIPPIRRKEVKHVYHLYILRCEKRDELKALSSSSPEVGLNCRS